MDNLVNRAVTLAKRPCGEPQNTDFDSKEQPIRSLQEGEILVRVIWLSLDPYMRPRMNDSKSYVDPVPIGGTMVGETVGEVIESHSPKFSVGDYVTAYGGWQEYFIINDAKPMLYKIQSAGTPLSAYLGAAGMTGRTAYFGLMEISQPTAGETLVVSAASGAVGSIVGQLGKMMGCQVVGIAGGPDKCRYVTEELGFDDCIDYKSDDLNLSLKRACPRGVDIYFENVGGDVTRAVAKHLNIGSRVPICGFISAYNALDISKIETPQHILASCPAQPVNRFFMQSEWQSRHQEITQKLSTWIKGGDLKYRESIAEGLDQTIEALQGMLSGKNFGKQLVRISNE